MSLGRQIALVLLVLSAVLVAAILLADGCSQRLVESDSTTAESAPRVIERERDDRRPSPPEQTVQASHCPPEVPECAVTEGEIFYVEEVDPDGDGDAHFVVWDSQSITLPGLTAIDLEKSMRPDPLPGPGDLISAAGPVQTGSYGQSQIHAIEFHVGKPVNP